MSSYIRRTDTLQSLKVHNLIPEGSTGNIVANMQSVDAAFRVDGINNTGILLAPYVGSGDYNQFVTLGDSMIAYKSDLSIVHYSGPGSTQGVRLVNDETNNNKLSVGINTTTPTATLDVAGTFAISVSNPPTNATDPGVTGQIAWDSGYIYVCTATDTWVRAALSTWP